MSSRVWQGQSMATTYLVGVDGSASARSALAWARAVAAPDEAIIVVHAWDSSTTTGFDGVTLVDSSIEAASQEFVDRVVTEQADPRVSGRVRVGHTGMAIVELAEEVGADMTIVVGHKGSGKASLLLGSTVHYVVHHTASPVVVVRGESRVPVRRVVVGVDDTHDDMPDEQSLAALRWAVRLPGVERIEVSHADFVPGVAAGPLREPGLESDEAVLADNALLRHAVDLATDGTGIPPNGAQVVPVVASGTGAFALIEASREVDLVVVGTRGRSGLLEVILGSTSLDVLAHAHCPVAVVR